MAGKIEQVKGRAALKPRHEPYWQRVRKGCYVGFRKKSATAPGAWVAKYRDDDTGKRASHSLGAIDDLPESEKFDAAKKAAEEWFAHLGAGGSNESKTLRDLCADYLKHLRAEGKAATATDAEGRFRRWIYSDAKLAATPALKLTPKLIDGWRKNLRQTLVIPQDKSKPATKPRSDASVNRDMSALRAALNFALHNGDVTSAHAWAKTLAPIKGADGRRDVYLDAGQRRKLIKKAPADLADFLKALCLVPLRPGAVAALNVAHFDRRFGTLTIGKDKAGGDRRITLPPSTVAFFAERAKDKLPAAPLLARADGKRWDKDAWKGPVRDAVKAAGLPSSITAYALRHSTITDLVAKHGLPTLIVAQLSGTSVSMIEKHYGHLLQDQARDALARLAL